MKKLLLVTLIGVMTSLTVSAQRIPEYLQKLFNAVYGVSAFYVDSVDENKLVEDAIKGMLEELDPHSSYTNAKETKEMTEPLQGEFEGIGHLVIGYDDNGKKPCSARKDNYVYWIE